MELVERFYNYYLFAKSTLTSIPTFDVNDPEKKALIGKQWGMIIKPNDCVTILEFLDRFRGHKHVAVCEIGTASGATANRIVEYLRLLNITTTYFGLDNLSLGLTPSLDYGRMYFRNGDRESLAELVTESLDFAFVDGCHCEDCVREDSIVISRYIKPGGFMLFHDASLFAQYPSSLKSRLRWQHYGTSANQKPLAVLKGIETSQGKWAGEWDLIVQDNDHLPCGGIRIYERTK